jgi:hypothetical protein
MRLGYTPSVDIHLLGIHEYDPAIRIATKRGWLVPSPDPWLDVSITVRHADGREWRCEGAYLQDYEARGLAEWLRAVSGDIPTLAVFQGDEDAIWFEFMQRNGSTRDLRVYLGGRCDPTTSGDRDSYIDLRVRVGRLRAAAEELTAELEEIIVASGPVKTRPVSAPGTARSRAAQRTRRRG